MKITVRRKWCMDGYCWAVDSPEWGVGMDWHFSTWRNAMRCADRVSKGLRRPR